MKFPRILAAGIVSLAPGLAAARPSPACPMEKGAPKPADCPMAADAPSGGHLHDLGARSDEGMGFSQTKTTHHFRLRIDGGAIEVTVRDAKDSESLGQIRAHLAHVREMFAAGDFSVPMFVHGQRPPGSATMKRRAGSIRYAYEDIPGGGRVSISTTDRDALDAVHDFLRFQIVEHETGDPALVPERR